MECMGPACGMEEGAPGGPPWGPMTPDAAKAAKVAGSSGEEKMLFQSSGWYGGVGAKSRGRFAPGG